MDVSGLFSDGGDRGAKEAPEGLPPQADPGRDGHHDRPTHLQAVSAGSGEVDPIDMSVGEGRSSDMMIRAAEVDPWRT